MFSQEKIKTRAYLDIETTGLSPSSSHLTVVGVYIEKKHDSRFLQFVGHHITSGRLKKIAMEADILYTYNGSRFDLPFIRSKLGIDMKDFCRHDDLMYSCWKKKLYGGLKNVEKKLSIQRKLTDIDGWMAVKLWRKYKKGDKQALETLLEYNKEDVINLSVLRRKLGQP